jgi:hypothetical protein
LASCWLSSRSPCSPYPFSSGTGTAKNKDRHED